MSQHILKISRLEGLTDGVFAIAMTILVLDLRIPAFTGNSLSYILEHEILYRLLIYIGSFTILGTLWIGMTFQIGLLQHINRIYLWTNIIYLMVICVVPFSASLVASYPESKLSIVFYAINLLCASLCQYIIQQTSFYCNLNNDLYTSAIRLAVIRRIFLAPIFYIAAIFVMSWDLHAAFALLIAPTLMYIFPGKIDKYEDRA